MILSKHFMGYYNQTGDTPTHSASYSSSSINAVEGTLGPWDIKDIKLKAGGTHCNSHQKTEP
ncbi:hypothetical protein [Xenorhabdus entomophaga]|uniref:hypothetical protein n=1 Tax=Xenorhabdus entomophaga TaxID=3136257 RepID=UPI0030F396F5